MAAVVVVALAGGLLLRPGQNRATAVHLASASSRPTETASASPSPYVPKTDVTWNSAVGQGSRPDQVQVEQDFVKRYNATNTDNIELWLQWSLPDCADCTFANYLASSQAADIFGPGGSSLLAFSPDFRLGLNDEIAKNKTDLGVYPPALLSALKNPAGQFEGLPYDESPAFIFYNKDLFATAGLPDLPTKVGEKYLDHDWTWTELATVAKLLTLDSSGHNAIESSFNASKIQQYGFDDECCHELRRLGTTFGAGSYLASDGKTAQLPPVWEETWKWYYDALWTSHFAPTDTERTALESAASSTAATGRVAMELAWSWGVDSFGASSGNGQPVSKFQRWDMAVLPSNDGVTTVPVDSDMFVINEKTKVPDAAYKAMLAIMADPAIRAVDGSLPLDPAQQAAYFKALQAGVDREFANSPINWSVLTEMDKYAASPAFDAPTPNYGKVSADDYAFYDRLQTKSGLNLDTEIAKFKATLQADFNSTG